MLLTVITLVLSGCAERPNPLTVEIRQIIGEESQPIAGAILADRGDQLVFEAVVRHEGNVVNFPHLQWTFADAEEDENRRRQGNLVTENSLIPEIDRRSVTISADESVGMKQLSVVAQASNERAVAYVEIDVHAPQLSLMRINGAESTPVGARLEVLMPEASGEDPVLLNFSATVNSGVPNRELAARELTWSFAAAQPTSEATEVDNGALTIGADETRQQLQLVVTDATRGASQTVEIVRTPPPKPELPLRWGLLADPDTDVEWIVLVPPTTSNGYQALITTKYLPRELLGPYHLNPGFTPFIATQARQRLNNWFSNLNNVGPILRAMALDYEFQDASGNSIPRTTLAIGAGVEVDRPLGAITPYVPIENNLLRAITRPVANSNATAEPFILSVSEVNRYFGEYLPNRQTCLASSTQTQFATPQNPNPHSCSDPTASPASWWLRSPSFDSGLWQNQHHAIVNGAGAVTSANAITSTTAQPIGIRPALWIQAAEISSIMSLRATTGSSDSNILNANNTITRQPNTDLTFNLYADVLIADDSLDSAVFSFSFAQLPESAAPPTINPETCPPGPCTVSVIVPATAPQTLTLTVSESRTGLSTTITISTAQPVATNFIEQLPEIINENEIAPEAPLFEGLLPENEPNLFEGLLPENEPNLFEGLLPENEPNLFEGLLPENEPNLFEGLLPENEPNLLARLNHEIEVRNGFEDFEVGIKRWLFGYSSRSLWQRPML